MIVRLASPSGLDLRHASAPQSPNYDGCSRGSDEGADIRAQSCRQQACLSHLFSLSAAVMGAGLPFAVKGLTGRPVS